MPIDKNLKILLVDDDNLIRILVKKELNDLGYFNLESADNAKTALERLAKNTFDLVITDWNMPIMTGLELLKIIKTTEAYSHIPVLMLTSESTLTNIMDAFEAGLDNYIIKPVTKEVLEEKLEEIFE